MHGEVGGDVGRSFQERQRRGWQGWHLGSGSRGFGIRQAWSLVLARGPELITLLGFGPRLHNEHNDNYLMGLCGSWFVKRL